jgi:hypothetical protein
MSELSPSSSGQDASELLSSLLAGQQQSIGAVARELGLTTLDITRGVVSYALSSPQSFELEDALRRYGLTRNDFAAATLLASADWEDEVVLAEGLSQVYEQFPLGRSALAELARVLASPGATAARPALVIAQNLLSQDLTCDASTRDATLKLAQLIPAGFENVVLQTLERQSNLAGTLFHGPMLPAADAAQSAAHSEGTERAVGRGFESRRRRGAFSSVELLENIPGGFDAEVLDERDDVHPENDGAHEQQIGSRFTGALDMLLDDGDACEPPAGLATRTVAFVAEHRPRRNLVGFTLVRVPFRLADLAVAAGILIAGMLTLLPAIQRSRTRMSLAACAFNLQQLGLALRLYGDTQQVYPFPSYGHGALPTGNFAAMLHDEGFLADLSTLECPACRHGMAGLAIDDETGSSRKPDFAHYQAGSFGDYAYNVGYRDKSGDVNPIPADASARIPLLADQPNCRDGVRVLPGNSANHGGQGQNVLFSDLHVSWHASRRISPQDDDMFLNFDRAVSPGLSKQDTVLLPKNVPFRGSGAQERPQSGVDSKAK